MEKYDYSFLTKMAVSSSHIMKMKDIAIVQERVRIWKGQYPAVFRSLEVRAHLDSVRYGNLIEYIDVPTKRIEGLLSGDLSPETASDLKVMSYSVARNDILSTDPGVGIDADYILALHRKMMEGIDDRPGMYRIFNHPHVGHGVMSAVRVPADVQDIEVLLESLVEAMDSAMSNPGIEPLLLIPCFMLDYMYISPFDHGNGRTYRLLCDAFMTRAGYDLVRYVSLDRQWCINRHDHVMAIYHASKRWSDDTIDHSIFIDHFLNSLWNAAMSLNAMFPPPSNVACNKSERIRHVIRNQPGYFMKRDLYDYLPDVAHVSIQHEISQMVSEGELERSGTTKSCKYVLKTKS